MKKFISLFIAMIIVFSAAALAEGEAVNYSVTTGLPTDKTEQKLLAVQFDNTAAARPQINMIDADVIYEGEMWQGGYTRYTAIYNDTIPETVEATRSARIMHIDMALDWDATFVHFGGQQMAGSSVYDYSKTVPLKGRYDGLSDGVNFYRDKNRVAPYNVVTRLKQIYDGLDETKATTHTPLTFSADAYTVKGDDVKVFRIGYSQSLGYYPSYEYNASEGVYYRYYNRASQLDGNGQQYTCSNVIVMQADYSWYDGAPERPIVALTGSNKCDYFIDGKHFTGTWTRDSVTSSTTYYDADGNVVVFKPGKTFIQLVKKAEELEIVQ